MRVLEIYNELKEVKHAMKVLEVKEKALKDETITQFLINSDEIVSPEGLVIITYKAHTETRFQQTIFKEEKAELYNQYCLESIVKKFLVK